MSLATKLFDSDSLDSEDASLRALIVSLARDPAFASARERASLTFGETSRRLAAAMQIEDREAMAQVLSESSRRQAALHSAETHYMYCTGCEADPDIDRNAVAAVRDELFAWLALLAKHPDPETFLVDRLRRRHPRVLMLLAESPPD